MIDLADPFKASSGNGERRKLNIFFAFFAYGGNGGTQAEAPTIREWAIRTVLAPITTAS